MNEIISQYMKKPGNASFLLDIPGCEELYQRCKDAEETVETNYEEFFRCVRLALEEFAKNEELKVRLKRSPIADPIELKKEIQQEFSTGADRTNIAIKRLARENGDVKRLCTVLCDHFNLRSLNDDEVFEKLEFATRKLRNQGNSASHPGDFKEDYDSSQKAIELLFNIISAYYGKDYKYDFRKQPFGKYYPVPQSMLDSCGVRFNNGKLFFSKDANGKETYYLATPSIPNPSEKQQHAASMLNNLWNNNIGTPDNTISPPEYKCNRNGIDYCNHWIQLPGFSYPLTRGVIDSFNNEEKISIISGIVKGIATLHNFDPPLYHRAISLDSFVLYKLRNGKYKPLLVQFDCVKNTDETVDQQNKYTVFTSVKRKATIYHSVSFFAPELIKYCTSLTANEEIDWGKADIYSLGLLIRFFNAELTPEQNKVLEKMIDKEPHKRPDINTVKTAFCS